MTEDRRTELLDALDVIVNSDEIASECENANYHSALSFFEELRDELLETGSIGLLDSDDDE